MASEYLYGGNVYSLDPKYNLASSKNPYGNFTGYNIPFSQISSAVDPRTANQIKEASEHLNTGVKNLEVGNVQPDVFESIPKEHFKEMNRLAKLTGASLTFHAPMIDPTGITDRGWDKMSQQAAERQLWDAIRKSQELNPDGTVVTFHASSVGLPSAEYKIKEGKDEKIKSVIIINESDGKINQIKEEERYFESDTGAKQIVFNPDSEIKRINEDAWMQKVNQLAFYSERADEALHKADIGGGELDLIKRGGAGESEATKEQIEQKEQEIKRAMTYGQVYLRDSYRYLRELYDEVYKNVSKEDPEKAKQLAEYAKSITPFFKNYEATEKDPQKLREFAEAIEKGVDILGKMRPTIYKPIKEFAVEKAAETTANLAWKSYNEFEKKGKAAPIIALENHPAQQSLLTTGEELRDVIKKAQSNFVEKAVSEGLSRGDAEKEAKKLIGATWDVGHINMLRRYGYDKEDIVKQSEAVAPFVKKIHLSDNFGFEHTELPMGMGNVPIKEIMEKLGKEGYEAKKVIEAGNWWQHFSQGGKSNPPFVPTLQAFGSNMYGMNWNQIYGVPGGYFGGYGTMLPEQHFQMYGAGFSSLPMELGGQVANKDSKFSGTPMA